MADDLVERLPKEAAMLQEIAQSQARGIDWHVNLTAGAAILKQAAARIQSDAAEIASLEAQVAEARGKAFKEAAKVAGELEASGKTTTMEWANCMAHARDIAQAIRALADALPDRQK